MATPTHWEQCADAMKAAIDADVIANPSFWESLTFGTAVILTPQRRLEQMADDAIFCDFLAIGEEHVTGGSRRRPRKILIVHLCVRMKFAGEPTLTAVREAARLTTLVQEFFYPPKAIVLADDGRQCSWAGATPFTAYGREALEAEGVFVCPIEFRWLLP